LLTLLLWMVVINIATAVNMSSVMFKDEALAKCIKNLSERNHWKNSEQVTKITCHGKGIKNINGLAIFSQLKYLSLFNNALTSVDLQPFKHLHYLNIANNKLTQIKLENLAELNTLYLFKNKLTTIDFMGLSVLKKVRITNNLLQQLDLSPLISLEKAYFFDNKLKDLVVKDLPKLKFLEVRQNPMTDEVYDRYDELDGITIVHDGNADDWK